MTDGTNNTTTGWIVFDQVEIDLAGRRLLVAGTQAALEPKAFAVLALFARHPGRAFSRDEILDAVWGHRHVTPGVLNRIITLLRQALGEGAQHAQYIATLHGVGYRFDAATQWRAQREGEAAPAIDPPAPSAATLDAQAPLPGVTQAPAQTAPRGFRYAAAWLAVLLAVVIAAWTFWPQPRPAENAPTETQSVAVLPLVNATGDANQQYFADGIAENLIGTLSQYDALRVIGRSSSFLFRDSREGAKAIGARLGVSHLIEGSVRRDGDTIRVGIELNRVVDGSTIWTQKFDRPYKDLFALQDEIALAVAGALQVKLLHAMPGAVYTGRPSTGNLDAYNAYLRGTSLMMGPDLQKAIEEFSHATQIDPAYAQAWSWLGFMRTQYARFNLSGDDERSAFTQAREEIDTALRLQPNFGQAHAIRANWLWAANHDWNGALAEFRIALPLVPETDPTHGAISRLLSTLGRIDEAIIERRKYIDGDPLGTFAFILLANLQASIGRLDEAHASLQKAAQVQPDQTDLYASERSEFAVLRGDAGKALAEATSMSSGYRRDRTLAFALQMGGDREAADAALQRLIDAYGQSKGDAYIITRVYALRGDADKTFEWLQRDWDRGATAAHYILFDPLLLRFRNDPRFAAYCQRAGLPPPSASEALSLDRIRTMVATKG
ncbi:MAG: winged helix-turn-helix domain-containing protein [Proteobacteria bacterium]|nr:winged helix-turn-helix domain-containing protein [Pseudomonadota bacterium]